MYSPVFYHGRQHPVHRRFFPFHRATTVFRHRLPAWLAPWPMRDPDGGSCFSQNGLSTLRAVLCVVWLAYLLLLASLSSPFRSVSPAFAPRPSIGSFFLSTTAAGMNPPITAKDVDPRLRKVRALDPTNASDNVDTRGNLRLRRPVDEPPARPGMAGRGPAVQDPVHCTQYSNGNATIDVSKRALSSRSKAPAFAGGGLLAKRGEAQVRCFLEPARVRSGGLP